MNGWVLSCPIPKNSSFYKLEIFHLFCVASYVCILCFECFSLHVLSCIMITLLFFVNYLTYRRDFCWIVNNNGHVTHRYGRLASTKPPQFLTKNMKWWVGWAEISSNKAIVVWLINFLSLVFHKFWSSFLLSNKILGLGIWKYFVSLFILIPLWIEYWLSTWVCSKAQGLKLTVGYRILSVTF